MSQLLIQVAAALLAVVPAAPSTPPASTEVSPAPTILTEASRIYEEAADPVLVNDGAARLAIYRRALAHLDGAPPDIIHSDEIRIARLFYRSAIAVHRPGGLQAEAGAEELAALLSDLRAAQRDFPDSLRISASLAQILRLQTNAALIEESFGLAAGFAREAVDRMRAIVDAGYDDDFTLRALAIDLDNLARIEARLGYVDKSSELGMEAIGLFRKLAQRRPESRPAQGSLLISLVRRAVDLGEPELLDEAAKIGAAMAERGLLDDRYRPIIDGLDNIRAQAEQAAAEKGSAER